MTFRNTVKQSALLVPAIRRLFAQRDQSLRERDEAVTEREEAASARDVAVKERDQAVRERNEAVKERDQALARSPGRPLDDPKIHVETEATPAQLSRMLEYQELTWKKLGETEPYYNVITDDVFKMANFSGNEERFFSSGQSCRQNIEKTAARYDLDLKAYKDCFELGCGAGRITMWLADVFGKVIAADISPDHLRIAAETMKRTHHHNVDLVKVDTFASLDALPEFDVFVSFIVIQHNPPPVAAVILEKLLRKIRPGGLANFQCQTYMPDYSFSVADYIKHIDGIKQGDSFEMHCLPQPVIFDMFKRTGFRLLEVREDTWTGVGISNSFLALRESA
jgi:SAM-dependent methyltransferase